MIFFSILCLLSSFLLAEPSIRIRIAPPAKQFNLSGDVKVDLQASNHGIILNKKPSGLFVLELKNFGVVSLDKRQFKYTIEVKQVDGQLILNNLLPLEAYITGVISSELPASWPIEVLKAQAIAARTYAVWQKSQKDYLESSVLDQVYSGVQREHPNAQKAVQETKAQILTYKNRPVHAYFHSTCGGHTADSGEIFGVAQDYLKGVPCPYCSKAPSYFWSYTISGRELRQKLGKPLEDIEKLGKTKSGRIKSGEKLRQALGYSNLKSTLITKYKLSWGKARFEGKGYGHGVGMCQWGTLGMAKKGHTALEILQFYYPGTEIRKFY